MIARKFPGRNQHQIKNRLIKLLVEDNQLSKSKVFEILKCEKTLASNLHMCLENIQKKPSNVKESEQGKNFRILTEISCLNSKKEEEYMGRESNESKFFLKD